MITNINPKHSQINHYYLGQTSKIPKLNILNVNIQKNQINNNYHSQQYDQLSTKRFDNKNYYLQSVISNQIINSNRKNDSNNNNNNNNSSPNINKQDQIKLLKLNFKSIQGSPQSQQHSQIIGKYHTFWEYKNAVYQKYFWGNGVYSLSDLTEQFLELQRKLKCVYDQMYLQVSKQEDSILINKMQNQIIEKQTSIANYFITRIQNIIQQSQLNQETNIPKIYTNTNDNNPNFENDGSTKITSKQDKNSHLFCSAQQMIDFLNNNILKHTQSIQEFSYGQILQHSKYSARISRMKKNQEIQNKKIIFDEKSTTQKKTLQSQQHKKYQILQMLETIYSLRRQNRSLKMKLKSLTSSINNSFNLSLHCSQNKISQMKISQVDSNSLSRKFIQTYKQAFQSPSKHLNYESSRNDKLLLSSYQKQNIPVNQIISPKISSNKFIQRIPKYILIGSKQKKQQENLQKISNHKSYTHKSSNKNINANIGESPIERIFKQDTQNRANSNYKFNLKQEKTMQISSKVLQIKININNNQKKLRSENLINQFNAQQEQKNVFEQIKILKYQKYIIKQKKLQKSHVINIIINPEVQRLYIQEEQKQTNKSQIQFNQSSILYIGSFLDQSISSFQNRDMKTSQIYIIQQVKKTYLNFKSLFKIFIKSVRNLNQKNLKQERSMFKMASFIKSLSQKVEKDFISSFLKNYDKLLVQEIKDIRTNKLKMVIQKIEKEYSQLVVYKKGERIYKTLNQFCEICIQKANKIKDSTKQKQ